MEQEFLRRSISIMDPFEVPAYTNDVEYSMKELIWQLSTTMFMVGFSNPDFETGHN